jgi:transposase-like protein
MAHSSSPLTALSEVQRTQALERFTTIRPALEKEITQAQVARTHQISLRTVQRWMKSYGEQGLALQTLPRSAAAIHCQVNAF